MPRPRFATGISLRTSGEAEEQALEHGQGEGEPQKSKMPEGPVVRHRPDRVQVLGDRVVHPGEHAVEGEEGVAAEAAAQRTSATRTGRRRSSIAAKAQPISMQTPPFQVSSGEINDTQMKPKATMANRERGARVRLRSEPAHRRADAVGARARSAAQGLPESR